MVNIQPILDNVANRVSRAMFRSNFDAAFDAVLPTVSPPAQQIANAYKAVIREMVLSTYSQC